MKKVAAYIRVSKERDGMISPDLYRRRILDWAAYKGIEPDRIEWFEDIDFSGRLTAQNRPGQADMLARRAEFDMVVVPRLDRFGRSLRDCLDSIALLIESGTDFAAADIDGLDTSSSSGKLILHIFLALAQFESDRIGDVWKATHARRRSQGKHHPGGTIPFGYRYDADAPGGMRQEPEEAEKVREAFERYVEGESQASLAKELGFRNADALSKALQRPTYAALMPDGSEGAWEPIITPETFEQAQARRKTNGGNKYKGRPKGSGTLLLTGLLYCGRCGAPCQAGSPKGYKCTRAAECGMWHVDQARANQTVIDEFAAHGLEQLKKLAEERKRRRKTSPLGTIEQKIAKVDQKIARLVRRAAETESETFLAAFEKETVRLQAEREALGDERAKIKTSEVDDERMAHATLTIKDEIAAREIAEKFNLPAIPALGIYEQEIPLTDLPLFASWVDLSLEDKRLLLRAAIERVETVEGKPRSVQITKWRAA